MNVISMWRASIIIRSLSSPRNLGLALWLSFASANRGWSAVIIGAWSIITKNWTAENEQLSWYNISIITNRNFTGEGCLLNYKTSYNTVTNLYSINSNSNDNDDDHNSNNNNDNNNNNKGKEHGRMH